jgi:ribonuclease HI
MSSNDLIIHTDGGSRGNPGLAGVGVVVYDQAGEVIYETDQFLGTKTNNEAEYEGFLTSLNWLLPYSSDHQIDRVIWKLDSKLVVEQLNKNWKIKEPRMRKLAEQIWQQLSSLPCSYVIQHIRREDNAAADALANQAMDAGSQS